MSLQKVADACLWQAEWAERLRSPLYHTLLSRMAEDVRGSGPCWRVLEPHAAEPDHSLPLRFLASVHRLVLERRLPELARYYPSGGGAADAAAAWPVFIEQVEQHEKELSARLPKTVQTNEVARCCALLPGFLAIAGSTGMPLRLLEIGCSAGLNLRWDCFSYATPAGVWGDPGSPVKFGNVFAGDLPPVKVNVSVSERGGCDLNPIDPGTEEGRLTLLSFVWPDQTERFHQLAAAIEVAGRVPVELTRSDALPWLKSQLADARDGTATVVFHSVVRPYLGKESCERMDEILQAAGARATRGAPLAWLAMEPAEKEAAVDLTLWPGGDRRRIAEAGFHGRSVNILAPVR
jgi:hypothetical protein